MCNSILSKALVMTGVRATGQRLLRQVTAVFFGDNSGGLRQVGTVPCCRG